jgi:serine protease Do
VIASLATDLANAAEKLNQSTVKIREGRHGIGTGVLWNANGLIVTNSHVVSGRRVTVETFDGRVFPAHLKIRDSSRDLAALVIEPPGPQAAETADKSIPRAGELVFALGNPFGLTGAFATGVIHAVGPVEGLGNFIWIQADIRLAPGNSGGPLADAQGRVIGINSMIAHGLGLAVPIAGIERFAQQS